VGTLIGGIVAVIVGILLAGPGPFGKAALWFFGGGIVVFLILGGIIAIAFGIKNMREQNEQLEERKEKGKVFSQEKGDKMYCPNCGREIEEGSNFCKFCGKKVNVNIPSNSARFYSQSGQYSGFAITSLVCGIIGFFGLWILAIIFGVIAKKQIRESEGKLKGRGMVTAGFVLGIIDAVVFLFWMIALIGGSTSDYF